MNRVLVVPGLAFAGLLAQPPRAAAQCNEACVEVTTPQGYKGYGCVQANDTGQACIARSTTCFIKLCYNTMITGPDGSVLAIADICGEKVTLRPVAREPSGVRIAAQPVRAKRGASVAAKARAG